MSAVLVYCKWTLNQDDDDDDDDDDWNKKDYGGQDFVKQMNFKSDLKGRVGLQDIIVSSVIRWSWCDQKIRHYTVVLVDSRRCV